MASSVRIAASAKPQLLQKKCQRPQAAKTGVQRKSARKSAMITPRCALGTRYALGVRGSAQNAASAQLRTQPQPQLLQKKCQRPQAAKTGVQRKSARKSA